MVQEGLIYDCLIDDLGIFQVQVLDVSNTAEVFVRVVRCTLKQKEILKKFKYRIHVPRQCLVNQSEEFAHVKTVRFK
ncbi:hypothetical protein H6231_002827 [Enterococcus hirae]|nr:hypothetical protein [Enterococcus hirae]